MERDGSNRRIATGSYKCTVPLIRASKLTSRDRGGIGKELSEGWCLNFAIGCTHGCPFCYVNAIHRRFGPYRYGDIVLRKWGSYLLTPNNIDEAIDGTRWERWRGKEVMLSSTHDPYIPELREMTRRILEKALPAGVRFCIQTRSYHITRDLELLSRYRDQVRVQVSIATMNERLARAIEPRVPPPAKRLLVLEMAKAHGIITGAIVAPVLPPISFRKDVKNDMRSIADALAKTEVDLVYGESLHLRGGNITSVEEAIREPILTPEGFDEFVASAFRSEMARVGLQATWWLERGHRGRIRTHRNGEPNVLSIINDHPSSGGFGIWQDKPRTAGIGSKGTSGN